MQQRCLRFARTTRRTSSGLIGRACIVLDNHFAYHFLCETSQDLIVAGIKCKKISFKKL